MRKLQIIIFILCLSFKIAFTQVYINEIMSLNISTIADEDGNFVDWIELVNTGNESVNLEGFSLSDDDTLLNKWIFPQVSIDAGQYLLIFASGKDRLNPVSLHTNFKIKSEGESLFLSDSSGVIIDSISAIQLYGDISYGRNLNEYLTFSYFNAPTPGTANGDNGYSELITEKPKFSLTGGYVSSSGISVSLSSDSGANIRYTNDGSLPDASSTIFSSPITISSSVVLKARIIEEGKLPGPIVTNSYIIDTDVDDLSLPMISISADPEELFGANGLFNLNPGILEKQVHFEFYNSDNVLGQESNAGMKIFGNESGTGYDYQQSLALFARRAYGNGKFNYRLFKEKSIDRFESFIMRNDNSEFNIFDAVGNGLVQDILAVQAMQPVVVFINGEYWGILNMMEKINEHYIADNFKIDSDSIDVLNGFETDEPFYHPGWPIAGNIDKYAELTDFLQAHDLSNDANYQAAKTLIDIPEYATYQNAEIFMANVDWPGNNMKFWRKKGENGKWRWIVFDIDAGLGAWEYDGFDATYNTLDIATEPNGPSSTLWGTEDTWPNPPWSTFVLRSLLENKEFENLFIATLCDIMATNFKPEISKPWIDARADLIINEIDNHEDRWDVSGSWYIEENKNTIARFLDNRSEHILEYYRDYFNLSGNMNELKVSVPDKGGTVKVNNQIIKAFPFSGKYFEELEITLSAIPDMGFEFVEWVGFGSSDSLITISMSENKTLSAIFRPLPEFERIVINEICYSDSETNDWIELYNPTDKTIDLSSWQLIDNDDEPFIFPTGIELNADEYLVVCNDIEDFQAIYSSVTAIGNFNFGLSKRGDQLFLYNDSGQLIDQIEYKVVYPWPVSGNSISLIDPMDNNNQANYWQNSEDRKTPGTQNDIVVPSGVKIPESLSFTKLDAYPNPFTNFTTINYELEEVDHVVINLYDIHGRLVKNLIDSRHEPGSFTTTVTGAELGYGVYYIVMQCSVGIYANKIVHLK